VLKRSAIDEAYGIAVPGSSLSGAGPGMRRRE